MGKITKTMQPKHEETLSPWLKDFVQSACTLPLPLLPDHIATFPTRWPFPRGDLYHWIPLLNRFDNILECFSGTYKLNEGPQTGDLGCEVLLHRGLKVEEYGTEVWDMDRLRKQGYGEQGDRQLIEAILKFTRVLLEHCGNRSIYASSNHLNDLLHATDLSVIIATLGVGSELAKRYQASVKRIGSHSRHVSTALLANHYNIALERVQLLASPFVKTPLISLSDAAASATPGSAAKGKDKIHTTGQKNAAPMFANDLSAIVNSEPGQWNGWGDIKISYTAVTDTKDHPFSSAVDRTSAGTNLPSTPTPLRRSTTMGGTAQQTPRSARQVPGDEASPSTVSRSPAPVSEQATSSQKVFDLPQSVVASSSIYDLLARCPADAPPHTRYEYLNRVRIAKALLGSVETRQQALAIRLLAITNLAYIHPENVFMEKVMRQDIDETRRYQLVYQLAEIIHPTSPGSQPVPLWVQSIALALLEAISYFQARYQDVLSALNANVNHGILLYVIRKAVAGMKEDEVADKYNQSTEVNEWRKDLFSLTQHLAMSTRVGAEMVSAGLMDVLVEIMKTRSNVAQRNHATILSFIDGLIWSYQNAFHAFFNGDGLDAISELLVTSVKEGTQLADAGRGTQSEYHSSVVDYDIPFHHQQTLKWLLKFMHHMMTNSYSLGGNTDRLLRNLVDKSDLLASLREIMQHTKRFGSVLWTNSVTVLSDFINNDPTSFAAIAESRMIVSFLESVTGSPVPEQTVAPRGSEDAAGEADDAPQENNDQVTLEPDDKPHPPPEEELAAGRDRPLARGILTSPDAMLVVPQVLNSISLNNVGLRMVVSSRAFESYFEMFESPKHVNCLEGEQHLASSVGESFDELCRHHPALRSPISDAVIDMVARVRFLGKDKAETSGWGAKLVFDDANGNVLTADHGLLGHLSAPPGDSKGKEKASTDDADVDMLDGAVTAKEEDSSSASSKEASKPAATAFDSITPYVHALGLFLTTYLSNNTMKTHFVQRGGIELLLDIAELPSLPYDFNESNASRKLFSVISQLVDHSPVLGLPALLKRAQAALDSLESFATDNDGRPYFAPFVLSEKPITLEDANSWDTTTRNKILTGTKVVRALLNAQSFLKTLYECFPSSPRSSSSVSLYPINFYDYYLQLIKSIGPLLRAGLTEEGAHWWAKKVGAIDEALAIIGRPAVPASPSGDDEETFLPDDLLGNFRAEALPNNKGAAAPQPKRPTKQEQATARFKNFETLRVVLHSMVPSSFPFFQQLGKAILPRRGGDTFSRQHHIDLAKGLSATIIHQLKPSMAVEVATPKDYHYWIIMLHTLSEMLIDATPRSSDRAGSQIIMPVYLAFVEHGGLEILTTMARRFADRAADQSSGTEPSAATKICSFGLKRALDLFATVVDGKTMADSAAQFGLIPRSAGPRPEAPLSNQMVLDARMAIFPVVREIWDSALMEKTQPETLSRVIDILKIVAVGSDESGQSNTQASDVLKRVPSAFNWRTHQTSLSALSRDYDDDLAREAVYRANGNQNSATEYCRAYAAGTAGSRNPVPTQDAYFAPPPEPSRRSSQQGAPPSSEPMALDAPPELDNLLGDAVLDELEGPSSEESDDDDDDEDEENDEDDDHAGEGSQKAGGSDLPPKANESAQPTIDPRATAKKTLDDHREQFRKELISRSLDIVRAHPHSAIEVSELISAMVFPQDIREDVGETLTSAITPLSFDSDEVESDANGSTIAAYAHLFALLLRDNAFLTCNIDTLRANVSTYVGFLKLSPTRAKDDLPPWIPYILLIVEILLAHDEKPIEATWKAPTSENEVIKPAVIEKPEAILSDAEQSDLLERILDILPRLGQEDTLAISVLRVLVVLTRKRSLARTVGEKKNLQRLFVMAKQLAGAGVNRLKDTKTAGRSQAREDAAAGEQTEVFQEFLDALPEEMRSEIVQQERQEVRRREREEQRRQAAGGAAEQEMDAASILLTFPPELRHEVLLDQGEDIMDQLPADMAAQVRLSQRAGNARSPPGIARRPAQQLTEPGQEAETKVQRKTVVQMLDKPGIATLLRLMFISQYGSIRNYLFSVLADVCENRQNRLEVISTVLLILQEGSTDMDAVERSFSQLSLKAKKPKDKDADPKTPQGLKRTLTSLTTSGHAQTNSEISPLLVVHQCLDLLQDLSTKNPHIPMLFLTEHESVGSSLKRMLSRKGKAKDYKAHKYAINALLSLLDRELVMESSVVMAYLADLLNKITVPLATIERRRREAAEKAALANKKVAEAAFAAQMAAEAAEAAATASTAEGASTQTDANDQTTGAVETTASATPAVESSTAVESGDALQSEENKKPEPETSKSATADDPNQKKGKQMQVPVIPPHYLTLVVKIFVARECSSKTFQNTISAIKNLSSIPGTKVIFGQELVRQARALSERIVLDLDELLPHIKKATTGTEIQGVALSKFSPGASEQNKLLRVLTALDHLFTEPKKKFSAEIEYTLMNIQKQDLVHSLYHNSTFSSMWDKLSECLRAIHKRENMVNVATILLPLIESLMVVCKNTATADSPAQASEKEMLLSSPPPESRMAGLFFNFTEDHRRILNELVRNNPKLMSGTFALLVKNPKVLEFDNKRNYFNRSVHSRASTQRSAFASLQLAVRREHVFHDSFRSLYFKSGDEMKYGKLNIRFHGEEGVDAGGVTREWFQVLARQMFDANYALFIPVSSDRTTFHPNKLSGINDMHLMYFKFVGRIIGKALYEGRLLDCYFSRAVYKRILGKSVSVKDMESFDPDYYKSLVWMLENDITDIITETFSVEDDEFGVTTIVDLCPDGRNIAVTEENKNDYVRLVVEHKLLSSVKEQMEHFLKGFHEIIPSELIRIFNEQELELLISGLPDIDIDDWKSNTEYHNYTPSSQQIQWFWRAIRSFDKEELAKLLQFVTGTSKVPLNGFKELEGMNGVSRFNIHRDYGNKERLPSSHTCFNQLDLPEYESYETLRSQLMKAITAGSDYFGFA
ncbi:hypothetical protein BN1708_014885 [Verticillium longisporum]|uniref:HECT-type E3 ubiquitin transferase n=1 Tax=Verticillium longisporum TaxID=100787 RepID=A0A0G4M1D9_VERLO|nr:hypothetical protein BN1708_014885 [Verticillium longisporum]